MQHRTDASAFCRHQPSTSQSGLSASQFCTQAPFNSCSHSQLWQFRLPTHLDPQPSRFHSGQSPAQHDMLSSHHLQSHSRNTPFNLTIPPHNSQILKHHSILHSFRTINQTITQPRYKSIQSPRNKGVILDPSLDYSADSSARSSSWSSSWSARPGRLLSIVVSLVAILVVASR